MLSDKLSYSNSLPFKEGLQEQSFQWLQNLRDSYQQPSIAFPKVVG